MVVHEQVPPPGRFPQERILAMVRAAVLVLGVGGWVCGWVVERSV